MIRWLIAIAAIVLLVIWSREQAAEPAQSQQYQQRAQEWRP